MGLMNHCCVLVPTITPSLLHLCYNSRVLGTFLQPLIPQEKFHSKSARGKTEGESMEYVRSNPSLQIIIYVQLHSVLADVYKEANDNESNNLPLFTHLNISKN